MWSVRMISTELQNVGAKALSLSLFSGSALAFDLIDFDPPHVVSTLPFMDGTVQQLA